MEWLLFISLLGNAVLGFLLYKLRIPRSSNPVELADIIGLLNAEIERLYKWFMTNKGLYLNAVYEGQLNDNQYKQLLHQCAIFIYNSLPVGLKRLVLSKFLRDDQLIDYIVVSIDQKVSQSFLTNLTTKKISEMR